MRNARLIGEQGGDVARKPEIETRRPHPVAGPEDARERPRRNPVREGKAVNPTRQQLIRKRVD